jgi:glycosyltransferase involved in cell wall biosynthesis
MSSRPIRLFVDAHVFDGEYQGTRSFLKEIYKRIAQMPDRFELYLGAHDTGNLQKIFPSLPPERFIPIRSHNRLTRLGIELPMLLRKYGFDIAHFQYIVPFFKTCKYVVTTHDVLFLDTPQWFSLSYRLQKSFFFYLSLLLADLRSTVSDFSRRSIAKHMRLDPRSIVIIPNGVGEQFLLPYDKMAVQTQVKHRFSIENYVLYVSRIEPRKNHHSLLRAMRELGCFERGIQLVFVGHESIPSTSLNDELAQLSGDQARSFHWLKNISDEDLLLLMKAARLFAYPSLSEGFGIPPLEAGALKVPVVCSNTTAMGDFTFFGPGHVDVNNYDQFKSAMKAYIDNQPEESVLSRIAAEIQTKYSWDASTEILARHMEGLMAR